jgi:hypothetical protein
MILKPTIHIGLLPAPGDTAAGLEELMHRIDRAIQRELRSWCAEDDKREAAGGRSWSLFVPVFGEYLSSDPVVEVDPARGMFTICAADREPVTRSAEIRDGKLS